MKTSFVMFIMGLFMALSNISFAGSSSHIVPECCQKQEACCAKNDACCQGNSNSKPTTNCCEEKAACCESNEACCGNSKVNENYKNQFRSNSSDNKKMNCESSHSSCCN